MSSLLASALVFFTSAAVLVLEILAGRLLAPYVGVTLETFTGIIGVVLAGIALGTWYGGRLADRVDPRAILGPMLVLGGALGIMSLPIVRLFGAADLGTGPPAIILLSLAGFFAPAAVLSACTPTVIKIQLQDLDETGQIVGWLSALGTIGALFGSFITGFVLVAALPTPPIIYLVGGALVLSGIVLWFRLSATRPKGQTLASAVVLSLSAVALGQLIPSPCDLETAYFCASVVVDDERPSGRILVLDRLRHSYVDIEDPTHLELSYSHGLSYVTDTFRPEGQPIDALHIGGGGFTMPQYLAATRPGSTHRVFELDPSLVALAEDELGLELGEDMQAFTGDARNNLKGEPDGAYDLVIGDAFGGLAVPWHLTTVEVVREIDRVLADDGVYAINLIDFPPLGFARSEAATLREVFEHVVVISPPERLARDEGGNFIMVGSHVPVDVEAIEALSLERGDVDEAISTDEELDAFIGGAQVLEDRFAPVDQLLTPRL